MSRIDSVNATATRLAAIAIVIAASALGAPAVAVAASFDEMLAAAPVGPIAIASYDDVPAIPKEAVEADPFDAPPLTD